MKLEIKIIISVLLMICIALCFVSCNPSDKKYFEKVSAYSFWDNKGSETIPQSQFYNIMNDFLSDGKIVDGSVIGSNGKIKKIAFLGFDGTRADAISNLLHDENKFETNGYNYAPEYSGINILKKEGGIYLAYSGGEKGKETEQSTSTSAAWTTELTGVLHNKHGVKDNDNVKNMEYKTIMLGYAEKGLQTSFAFDWGQYFDINLKEEVKYLMANPQINATYKDIDRKVAATKEEMVDTTAENLEMHNFVANEKILGNTPYDIDMRNYIIERIAGGDDIVCGIFHNPDSNGHTDGFSNTMNSYVNSVRTSDNYTFEIINAIKERETKFNEEWLIMVAADHGGIKKGHGKQTYEERTIWMATNKKVDSKYFGTGYDGYKENK